MKIGPNKRHAIRRNLRDLGNFNVDIPRGYQYDGVSLNQIIEDEFFLWHLVYYRKSDEIRKKK